MAEYNGVVIALFSLVMMIDLHIFSTLSEFNNKLDIFLFNVLFILRLAIDIFLIYEELIKQNLLYILIMIEIITLNYYCFRLSFARTNSGWIIIFMYIIILCCDISITVGTFFDTQNMSCVNSTYISRMFKTEL